jgi:hypothetical protein
VYAVANRLPGVVGLKRLVPIAYLLVVDSRPPYIIFSMSIFSPGRSVTTAFFRSDVRYV